MDSGSHSSIVTEIVDAYPGTEPELRLERNEQLLFTKPGPPASKIVQEYPLLQAIHTPTIYVPAQFSPPKDIFSSEHIRIEWQQMNQRQPFYHRNADVDEISFHISGERTLMTERGSVDLQPGDFARIPVFTAHDNAGIADVHLIFYLTAPAHQVVEPARQAEFKMPPFKGWESRPIAEVITECLGTPGCDRGYSMVDEDLLLNAFPKNGLDPINIVNAYDSQSALGATQWLYKSEMAWLGSTNLSPNSEHVYRRHRRADEIQCQVHGTRLLVTQRGTIRLEPGDFINIPVGTAFTSIVEAESTHLSVLTRIPAEPKVPASKTAEQTTPETLQNIRLQKLSNGIS